MTVDIKEIVEKEWLNRDLWKRMDDDRDLYYLKEYEMVDLQGVKSSNVINVTSNFPATFAAHVQSSMASAEEQPSVTGDELEDEDTAPIERFLQAALLAVDRWLAALREAALRPQMIEKVNIRGQGAARVTFRKEAGQIIPAALPIDPRYFVYEPGLDRMEWGSYTTWRTPAMLRLEYPGLVSEIPGALSQMALLKVRDVWDKEVESIYVQDKLIDERENIYGYPPFVAREVPLGSMLKDTDALKHRGESIFFLIRDRPDVTVRRAGGACAPTAVLYRSQPRLKRVKRRLC